MHFNHKHGLSRHPLYKIWERMIARCHNPESKDYRLYGGRGIVVCPRWRKSVQAFINDMGDRPSGHSLERVNNDYHYCPANCIWATHDQQCNNRSDTTTLEWQGRVQSVSQWARQYGMKPGTLRRRLKVSGMSLEEALTKPLKKTWRGRRASG